ncbi:unnamed protein product [Adineta steineri]|uniref:NAD(P)(+)--arginine ADP-ribosyltransferase n=1 Tax=Adineta steineri TaxID=433720 RepID=A0A819MYW3_9BILA|nr:unnamed protein product [Adineta steineri]CAF3988399.1 unnamed protein product [Adineta steineri]
MIEEAYLEKKGVVVLDDYRISFDRFIQMSNKNINNQRPVKRMSTDQNDECHLRQERFFSLPIHPKAPFYLHEDHRVRSFFREETFIRMNFQGWNKKTKVAMVEQAAHGLIHEGKLIGKQCEAEWMAEKLLKVKDHTITDIWKCCVCLYTMESFLYKKLNEIMRLAGSEESQDIALWKSKISTLGPFACLLCSTVPAGAATGKVTGMMHGTVYRGAHFSNEMIAHFSAASKENSHQSFEAFTSCSRNRLTAEQFGNTLLIIELRGLCNVDASAYSPYQREEEQLLDAGFTFKVKGVKSNPIANKHCIFLQQTTGLLK